MRTVALIGLVAVLVWCAGCGGGGGGGGISPVTPGGTPGGDPGTPGGDPTNPSVYSGLAAEGVFGYPTLLGGEGASLLTWAGPRPLTNVLTGPLLQEVAPLGPDTPPVSPQGGSMAQLIEILAEISAATQHPKPSQNPPAFSWLDPATNVQWAGEALTGVTDATATIHGAGPGVDCTLSLHLTDSQGLGVTLEVAVDGTVTAPVTRVTDWKATPPSSDTETGQMVAQGTFTLNVKSSQLWEGQFTQSFDITGQEQYDDAGTWVTCQTDNNRAVLSGSWNSSRLTAGWGGSIRTDYAPEDSGLWVTHTLGGSVTQAGTDGVFLLDTTEGRTGYMTDGLLLSSGVYGTVRMDLTNGDSGLGLAYSGYLKAADGTQIATISGTSDPSDPPTLHWASGETTVWDGL